MRNRVILIFCLVIAISALGYIALTLFAAYQERDQTYLGRLHLARAEITAITSAVESFRKARGRYPEDLIELTTNSKEDQSAKPLLTIIPVSPWRGPYFYKIEDGSNGANAMVWTVPDRDTQERIGLKVLSNSTDWQAVFGK
jgi:Type II secretion system (T2SS), protein G